MACSRLSHSSAKGWLRRVSLYRLMMTSVAVAHALADAVRRDGYPVSESHRDLGRS